MNKLETVNEENTATFDKATKTITIKSTTGDRGLYLWLDDMDISSYNIARIKYRVIGDYGFIFTPNYNDDSIEWDYKSTYCPSYLNEMVIPFKSNQKRLDGIKFWGAWHVPYQQFVIESVTFEKVENPVITDVYACDEPPIVDTAASGQFDDKISAWDYIKKLGVGFQYDTFPVNEPLYDWGMDCYHPWGHKKPSKETVHFIRGKGFKTLRLQTGPESHLLDENYTIDPRYIKAIKEVVDWAIAEDMYVIICGPFSEWLRKEVFQKKVKESIHFEGVTVSEEYKTKTKGLLKAIWKQYATAFNNSYDEHLIFETLNEPLDAFHEHAWDPKSDCAVCKKDYAILNEYNQLIVDTIRSTGGNNAKRFIMVEGLTGKWQYITTSLFKMPKDKTKDRLIPTLHNYPLGFTLEPRYGGKKYYTDGMRKQINEMFDALDKTYFKKHVPVYISEVSGGPFGISVMERINCMKDFMAGVSKNGRSCAVTLHPCNDYYNNQSRDMDFWNIKWNEKPEYFDTVFYGAQGKEYPLSEEFIKNNSVTIPSIVGKNLLNEPVEKKNWGDGYGIKGDVFVRSTPAKYKIEFQIEKTGSNPRFEFGYWNGSYSKVTKGIKGGVVDGSNIAVKSDIVTISVDEKLAKELESAGDVFLNGQDIIIKSMKVVP